MEVPTPNFPSTRLTDHCCKPPLKLHMLACGFPLVGSLDRIAFGSLLASPEFLRYSRLPLSDWWPKRLSVKIKVIGGLILGVVFRYSLILLFNTLLTIIIKSEYVNWCNIENVCTFVPFRTHPAQKFFCGNRVSLHCGKIGIKPSYIHGCNKTVGI